MIWGVEEFPCWFQGPWVTLPLLPKISHFCPPRSQAGRMARVKPTLNHILLSIQVWFEALSSFYVDSRDPWWPCFPISIDVIWGAKEFPQWIPAPDRPCHCDLILTQKSPIFEAPVFMTEAWRWPKLLQTSLVYVHRRCMCDRCLK